jgi:hypothetical protein
LVCFSQAGKKIRILFVFIKKYKNFRKFQFLLLEVQA